MQPEVGDLVEDFVLPNQDGEQVKLSEFRGKPVVLFFYPRADTPGCTIEACGFRDQFASLEDAGVAVLGVSRDSVESQKLFQQKHHLNYALLSDTQLELIKRFDLLRSVTVDGKSVPGVARTTLLIGPDGRLLKVFSEVKPQGHAEEVLNFVRGIR